MSTTAGVEIISKDEVQSAVSWIKQFYASVDSKDPAFVAKFLEDEATLTYANMPTVQGEGIEKLIHWQFSGLLTSQHEIVDIRVCEDQIIIFAVFSFKNLKGVEGSLNACTVVKKGLKKDQKCMAVNVYADVSEMAAALIDANGPLVL
ncbi:hypothetical protein C8J56DRAFT_1111708 [Mycena floridula]|nr:hypothetical protein C8J56DRAFT_1111708 [Mycena floridula]